MTFAFLMNSVPITHAVIAGETSLGGSESALVGLARALAARGHQVQLFAARLGEGEDDPVQSGTRDLGGVQWHDWDEFPTMNRFVEWDVVCSSRQLSPFALRKVHARMRLLWAQDLLVPGDHQNTTMAISWALDHICYVSEYHRAQWEDLQPELKSLGWVTKNGYDPALIPSSTAITKDPNRIIHISRPERGLGPLLDMWPKVRAANPHAELRLCRYSSMYDTGPGSWSDECAKWDARVEQMNAGVGGITFLGELHKAALYRELSEAAVMWYPGVSTFAETGCIAAIESQACGTPVVASYRGVVPSVVTFGKAIKGVAEQDEDYQTESVRTVLSYMDQCKTQSRAYREGQIAGVSAMLGHAYPDIALEWEQQIQRWFEDRYNGNTLGVMRELLYQDDHVAAEQVARSINNSQRTFSGEAVEALELCRRVIDGKDHTAEQYGEAAIDPRLEIDSPRFAEVAPLFEGCSHVLDVACGNGSFALTLLKADPKVRVTGLDFSAANIAVAKTVAKEMGLADRCDFQQVTVYDFDRHQLHQDWEQFVDDVEAVPQWPLIDGLFVGEFVEHVQHTDALVDGLEALVEPGGVVVYTCPHGNCVELLQPRTTHYRGHVHRFMYDDIHQVWGQKQNLSVRFLDSGDTMRGNPLGNWLIHYERSPDAPARPRNLTERITRTRPMQRLSVGIIAKDAASDLYRCLNSLYGMADEIVIGIDANSSDDTKTLAQAFGRTVRTVDIPTVMSLKGGFSEARNLVLDQCVGEWFLWIDTDEKLVNPQHVRRYLDGSDVFAGYVVHQTHLYMDGPTTFDIPVRIFKRTPSIRFYGCIHEQPQDGGPNGAIQPTLEVNDFEIAHFGYLEESARELKRVHRNLPLLQRDQEQFEDRLLGQVLLIREAVLESDARARRQGGQTKQTQQGYAHAIKLFVKHFDDPAHHFHKLARPWYEAALQHLGLGWECEIALAGRERDMGTGHARPDRVRVRHGEEFHRLVEHKAKGLAEKMKTTTFITDPDALLVKPLELEAVHA